MECVPDLAFLQMAAATNNEMLTKMMWAGGSGSGTAMKQRKTNFTSREVEALLNAVSDRKDTVLFGVAGGLGWARAWHEVAQQVSAIEGIHRSESDVRKKWTYLKWEAKNTSKPGRDPTSRAVLEILTSRDRGDTSSTTPTPSPSASSNSLLEQLLVPQSGGGGQVVQSPGGGSPGPAPVPSVKKAVTAPPPPPAAPPEVCLRWNSYHSNMQATFPSLLNNEQFVDVTLACEGRSIKCHKVMLSACSSYFEELLSQNPCQHPIIFMRDLKFWEVQALVEFMYTGEVNVAQDKLPSLLTAAEALQIKGLTNPGGGTGSGSTGSYAASQEDDSNTTPELDDVSSPSYCPPTKKIRKRKATNPTSYHQKAQAVYSPVTQQSSPISSPMIHQVTAPPGLTPMRMMGQPTLGIVPQLASQAAPAAHSTTQPPTAHPGIQQTAAQPRLSQTPRIKKDPGSPPHSHLPPPHPPYTTSSIIKSEPLDDNMDTPLDFSESESRKEINASLPADEPLSLATNDQGPGSNGSQIKAQDNGLSEEDDQTGSECSDSGAMHIDPGETSDA